MAYIQPNSIVQFFGDLGLSPNYENSLYFASTSAKDSYFDGLAKKAIATSLSYNRENRGFIRVEIPMSTMYNVGYMRFRNTSFENKWFYAFVRQVNYINNVTTEVQFELDVLMTWMGAFNLNRCFIERQHTTSDNIGEHIVDEKLSTGEYVCEGRSRTAFFTDYRIALYRAPNPSKSESLTGVSTLKQGTYVPLLVTYYQLTSASIENLEDKINDLTEDNRSDEILILKLVPYRWATANDIVDTDLFTVSKPYSGSSAWGTFVPRNKKLYCYPYKYLDVINCEGTETAYKYEYFNTLPDQTSDGNCTFEINGSAVTPEVNVMCVPKNYNGIDYDYNNALTMEKFPTLAYNVDGYKAYIAQRDSTLFGNILANAELGATTGALSGGGLIGGLLGAGAGALSGMRPLLADNANKVLNFLSGNNLPVKAPNQTKGNISADLLAQMRNKDFYFSKMCITKNYAKIIDDYFTMYGYRINSIGTPNMNARPYFTFIKTMGCTVNGDLPADDGSVIESIFDNGVRFWKNHTQIGNYGLNNSPS